MALEVYLAASLRKYFPGYDAATGLRIEIEPGATVRDVAERLKIPVGEVRLIMVNGRGAGWDAVLAGDERVAYFPPVGGG
jgi:molybdopterin converting factor small subunit